jgi:hypothetical protein
MRIPEGLVVSEMARGAMGTQLDASLPVSPFMVFVPVSGEAAVSVAASLPPLGGA